jgi:CDP-diacylglycerol--glycerol-3-phosphate 3-phosphatidyltransferase
MTLRRAPTLNLPNQLTVLRLGMCGLLLVSLSFDWPYAATAALLIFSLASLTDWLDGTIARKYHLVTDLGKLLDPLADKILITCALIGLLARGVAPMWMVVLIIAREFLITGLRVIAASKHRILAAEKIGKHKTISQIVAILVSFGALSLGELGLGATPLARVLEFARSPLYWIALLVTVYSGLVYFWKNAAILNESMTEADEPPPVEPKPAPTPTAVAEIPVTAPTTTPAFKEWEGIVEALGHGAQIIILRKGGLAEGRAGFQAKHDRFWLFPTRYHAQWDKTRPELRRFAATASAEPPKEWTLRYFADVTDALYLESWEQVARLADAHFWSEELLRERFEYRDRPGMDAGLHLLLLRVHRINLPHQLAPDPAFEGCKSWIDVPLDWRADFAEPVVRDEEFATRRSRILAAVAAAAPAPAHAA